MIGARFSEEQHYLSKSVEPDYGDEEIHLSPESHWINIKNLSYSQKEGRADLFKRAG